MLTPSAAAAPARRANGRRVPVALLLAALPVVLAVAAALLAPLLAPYPPLDQDLLQLNAAPDAAHLLGTDHLGRDVLSRLLYGARTTLLVSLAGTLVAFVAGAGGALLALSTGRVATQAFFAVIDLFRALPGTLLALLLIVGLGSGAGPLTLALGVSYAPLLAHVTRAAYRRESARDYVLAARSFGGSRLHVLRRHLLPNLAGTLVTQAAIVLPRCIVTESVLSFLGVGSSPDAPTWGRMIADAGSFIEIAPHAIVAPLVSIIALTLGLSVLGAALRRRLDPLRAAVATAGD